MTECCPTKPLQKAPDDAVVVATVVAVVAAAFAAAVSELLLLVVRVGVRQGSVQSVVHVGAPRCSLCTSACARLGLHASVQAVGAGQRVQGGLTEPSAGARGPPGVARQRAWAARAQRQPPFAALFSLRLFLFST